MGLFYEVFFGWLASAHLDFCQADSDSCDTVGIVPITPLPLPEPTFPTSGCIDVSSVPPPHCPLGRPRVHTLTLRQLAGE
jgi:hypothetical protein